MFSSRNYAKMTIPIIQGPTMSSPCGWYGTIQQFFQTGMNHWLTRLRANHLLCMNEPESSSQSNAWIHEYTAIRDSLHDSGEW
jgi:hypothetical protein